MNSTSVQYSAPNYTFLPPMITTERLAHFRSGDDTWRRVMLSSWSTR